jgi:mono/diheme cytochrome c family protein
MSKFITLALLAILLACTQNSQPENEVGTIASQEELIERGKYLVTIGACHDCHSPKVLTDEGPMPDTTRLLSGHPQHAINPPIPAKSQNWVLFNAEHFTSFVGPWGVSFAANLTPSDYGTGSWTFEQFQMAIRTGKYKGLEGSRDLLPPMPWQMYRNFSDEDLKAIFAYLQSLKPVDNFVPTPIAPADLPKQ